MQAWRATTGNASATIGLRPWPRMSANGFSLLGLASRITVQESFAVALPGSDEPGGARLSSRRTYMSFIPRLESWASPRKHEAIRRACKSYTKARRAMTEAKQLGDEELLASAVAWRDS